MNFPQNQGVRWRRWRAPIGSLTAVAGYLLIFSGCQTAFLQPVSDPIPVPPPTLTSAQLQGQDETTVVRYQSPDSPEPSNRVLSKNTDLLSDLSLVAPATEESAAADPSQQVLELKILGNQRIPTHQLTRQLQTRPGRYFDPDRLQQDVNRLWRMKEISRVQEPRLTRTPEGIVVELEVVERPVITELDFVGNRGLPDRTLKKESGLKAGDPLDVHQIRMAKTRLEELYREKGFPRTQVEILEGGENGDSKVVFLIHEDEKQRIWKVEFEGNSIAPDARLRTFIKSKPGILKVFGGLVVRNEIDQDVTRLTSYYRSLGFFNARVGREINESNDGRWLSLRFIIDEGPRYRVRNVAFLGNEVYSSEQLASLLDLKPDAEGSPEFNVARMNQDVVALRDLYGSEGFITAKVEAEPRFLEEPGVLDLVYKIDEGQRYYVGNINVHFEGGGSITKREVALSMMDLRPGDVISSPKVRNAERRMGASAIFATGAQGGGPPPRIVLNPQESPMSRMAGTGSLAGGAPY